MGAKIRGISRTRAGLRRVSAEIDHAADDAAEEIADVLASRIERDAPVDTGALRSSVDAEGSTVVVGDSLVDYVGYVEDDDPFIEPNVQAVRREARKIAVDELNRELR